MALLTNNAEGGVDGVQPTTTDGGSGDNWTTVTKADASAVLEYTAVDRIHGGLGYRFAARTTTSTAFVLWDGTAAASVFGRFYLMCDVTPTTSPHLLQCRASAAGNVGCYINLATTRALLIRHGADSTAYTFTNLLVAGVWYRVEYNFICNIGAVNTAGSMQVKTYLRDSMQLIEDSGVVSVTTQAMTTCGTKRHGLTTTGTNTPSTTGFVYMDDIAAFGTTWVGASITDLGTPVDRRNLVYLRRNL